MLKRVEHRGVYSTKVLHSKTSSLWLHKGSIEALGFGSCLMAFRVWGLRGEGVKGLHDKTLKGMQKRADNSHINSIDDISTA